MKFEKISKDAQRDALSHLSHFDFNDFQDDAALAYIEDKLPLPKRGSAFSAGYDFYLPLSVTLPANGVFVIPTFIKAELDKDKVLKIYPRSSYGIKCGVIMANTVGIIDSDYYNNPSNEGHIMIALRNMNNFSVFLPQGDKFAQGIIEKFYVVDGDEYGKGEARTGGIGSTGK